MCLTPDESNACMFLSDFPGFELKVDNGSGYLRGIQIQTFHFTHFRFWLKSGFTNFQIDYLFDILSSSICTCPPAEV